MHGNWVAVLDFIILNLWIDFKFERSWYRLSIILLSIEIIDENGTWSFQIKLTNASFFLITSFSELTSINESILSS